MGPAANCVDLEAVTVQRRGPSGPRGTHVGPAAHGVYLTRFVADASAAAVAPIIEDVRALHHPFWSI